MISLAAMLAPNVLLWLCLLLFLAVWRSCRHKSAAGRWLALAALAGLWILSTRPVAEGLLTPLENRFPQPSVAALVDEDVRQVVVLTAGGFEGDGQLDSSFLPPSSVYRFLAGMELCKRIGPDCRLLFSGSAGRSSRSLATASRMEQLARRLAPAGDYRSESRSGSTAEHPENVAPLLDEGPFVLVTSGFHMARAMRSFERRNLPAIAFPTDLLVRGGYHWHDWLPSARSLALTSLASREYLAQLLYAVRGW